MATSLPSELDVGRRSDPNPAGPVSMEAPGTQGYDIRAQNTQKFANSMGGVAEELYVAREKFSQLQADDAVNTYKQKLLDARFNKESGWEQTTLEKAVDPKFYSDTVERFGALRQGVTDTLADPLSRQYFDRAAKSVSLTAHSEVLVHQGRQRQLWEDKTDATSRQLVLEEVKLAPQDERGFQFRLLSLKNLDTAQAIRKGVNPESADGAKYLKALHQITTDETISTRVVAQLNGGDAYGAKATLDTYGSELNIKNMAHLKGLVNTQYQVQVGHDVTSQFEEEMKIDFDENGAPKKRDYAGKITEITKRLEDAAEKAAPKDATFRKGIVSEGLSEWSRMMTAQTGRERAAQGAVLDFIDKTGATTRAQLMKDPKAWAAFQDLDSQTRVYTQQYMSALENKAQNNPQVWNDVVRKISSGEITDESALYPLYGNGLDPSHRGTLLSLMESKRSGGPRTDQRIREAQQAIQSRLLSDPMIGGNMMVRPMVYSAVYAWGQDVDKRIREKMQKGESVEPLFMADGPESIVNPAYVNGFMANLAQAGTVTKSTIESAKKNGTAYEMPKGGFKTQEESDAWARGMPQGTTVIIDQAGKAWSRNPNAPAAPARPATPVTGKDKTSLLTNPAGGGVSDALLDSIRTVEFGDGKILVNPTSGAMGPFQFLPTTVAMLRKQGHPFDPFDEVQSREAARYYMNQLIANNRGDVKKALADYGGVKSKDVNHPYVQKVVSGVKNDLVMLAQNDTGTMTDAVDDADTPQTVAPATPVKVAPVVAEIAKNNDGEISIDDIKIIKPAGSVANQLAELKKKRDASRAKRKEQAIGPQYDAFGPFESLWNGAKDVGDSIQQMIPTEPERIVNGFQYIKNSGQMTVGDFELIDAAAKSGLLNSKDEALAKKMLKKIEGAR